MIISSINKLTNKNKSKNLYFYCVTYNVPIYIDRFNILGFATGISFKATKNICKSIGIYTQGKYQRLTAKHSHEFNGYYGVGIMIYPNYKLYDIDY
tara:strand:+ start:843 stop:1130 length:288 start_codon:yes stop_codon:yes gene_type:complete